MAQLQQFKKVRFEAFEFDLSTGELHKSGRPIRLQGQPARLLSLLASRPRELVTRAEIQSTLWPDGRFVEFEHAINTAIKKVREALEDDPESPRFVETLPKLGYRFMAPVEEIGAVLKLDQPEPTVAKEQAPGEPANGEFSIPYPALTRRLFLLIQICYLTTYCTALYYMPALENALIRIGFVPVGVTFPASLVIAMCGIAIRLYLLSSVGWRHPAAGRKFLRLFPLIFALDALWAACPLLAVPALGAGIALACVVGMAYLPFAQRTLIRSIYQGQ
jgi:DNA-binding winged helix-turn-helix (wHTH) protein